MRIGTRATGALLALIIASFGLVACGGDDSATKANSQDVNKLLDETFSTEGKATDSGVLDVAIAIDAQGSGPASGPIELKLKGPFVNQGDTQLPKLDLDAEFSGAGQKLTAGATSTGDKGFISFNGTDYAVGDDVFGEFKKSYETAAKESQGQKATSLATLGVNPKAWLKSPKNAGEAKVGDDDTIKITGQVDVPLLLDDVNKALAKASQLGLNGASGGQVPTEITDAQKQQIAQAVKGLDVEIYTGKEDKILRRLLVDLDVALPSGNSTGVSAAKVKFDLKITDINEDQEIKAPANTRPLDELLQQFGGLGGLGGLGGGAGATGPTGATGGASSEKGKEYTDCLAAAGNDIKKAQECSEILNP